MPTAWPGLLGLQQVASHNNPTRERGIIAAERQRAAHHTNPKRERGSSEIDCERTCAESTAAYSPAAGAPTALRDALASASSKIDRLRAAGFALSRNDRKIILYGQLLTTLTSARDAANLAALVDGELSRDAGTRAAASNRPQQQELFERV